VRQEAQAIRENTRRAIASSRGLVEASRWQRGKRGEQDG
jgi:hypothetical protein